jgi:hypothetical protein
MVVEDIQEDEHLREMLVNTIMEWERGHRCGNCDHEDTVIYGPSVEGSLGLETICKGCRSRQQVKSTISSDMFPLLTGTEAGDQSLDVLLDIVNDWVKNRTCLSCGGDINCLKESAVGIISLALACSECDAKGNLKRKILGGSERVETIGLHNEFDEVVVAHSRVLNQKAIDALAKSVKSYRCRYCHGQIDLEKQGVLLLVLMLTACPNCAKEQSIFLLDNQSNSLGFEGAKLLLLLNERFL